MTAAATWRIAPAGSLLTAELDGHTVVYHTGAGHTHWVSAVAAEVLHALALGPMDTDALCAELEQLVSPEDKAMLADTLKETLDDLKHLSLIEPA